MKRCFNLIAAKPSSKRILRAFTIIMKLSTLLSGVAKTMRAIRVHEFGGPEVLKVDSNVPVPVCSGSQVLVRVASVGVNPVETYIRSGTHPLVKPKLPYTPGTDGAGLVENVGESVSNFKQGDRVFCTRANLTGTYAEYCVADEKCCWPLGQRLTFSQGAAIGVPYFTAYRALIQNCKTKPSHRVLVHGASGATGLAAVQLARAYGMTVYGTAGTQEGLDLVKKIGAHHVFNHRDADYMDKIMETTEKKGINVILEMLSNVNLAKDLDLVSQNGVVVIVGCRGPIEINPRLMMNKESSIVGVGIFFSTESDWREMGAALSAGFDQGWLTPVVDKEYPLQQACQAHHDIIESFGAKGKLVLSV